MFTLYYPWTFLRANNTTKCTAQFLITLSEAEFHIKGSYSSDGSNVHMKRKKSETELTASVLKKKAFLYHVSLMPFSFRQPPSITDIS